MINIAFIRSPLKSLLAKKGQYQSKSELAKMRRDFTIVWVFSFVLSIILSGFFHWYYQLPLIWCVVLVFYNSQIIPTFCCFAYRDKNINYSEYFIEHYSLISEKFRRSIDSVTSWFLTCLFPINIFNNYLYGGSHYESLINVFYWLYAFLAFAMFFLRGYLSRKFL